MNRNSIFLAVSILILLSSCGTKEKEWSRQTVQIAGRRPEKDFRELLGKDLSKELSAVVPTAHMERKPVVLLLYNRFDCFSCMRSGFYLARKIDSLSGGQRVFVVGIMANRG